MKSTLIALLAGASLALFATVTLADGDGCESKKRAKDGQQMSMDMKQHMDKQGWHGEGHGKHQNLQQNKSADVNPGEQLGEQNGTTDSAVKS